LVYMLCFNINNNKGNNMSSTFSLGSTITNGCLLYDNFSPLTLFTAGEQGYWLDPSDLSTMFQDTAGATPVTAVGQSVRRWLDKSGRGNHFTQSSTSNAPILGRNPIVGTRNLLTRTEEFDNASWFKTASTVTANAAVSPDGTADAEKLIPDAASISGRVIQAFTGSAGATYTLSLFAKQAEFTNCRLFADDSGTNIASVSYNLSTGAVSTAAAIAGGVWTGVSSTITAAGNGWWRITLTWTATSVAPTRVSYWCRDTGDGTSGIFIWGAQLETGSTATAYQRVGSAFDVTESGVPDCYYLSFDGTDDWLQSGTITPGTDKVQVFAGVRKLSDAGTGTILEASAEADVNSGSLFMRAPHLAVSNYRFFSRGTASAGVTSPATFAAPITSVLTGLGDIAGDSAILRVNGTQVSNNTADQGTGNYLAYPHYIGRRAGTLLPFNGRIYQLITRFGENLPLSTILQTEIFTNQRTGAY
jgi:hypothetical protein